jgi:phage repressor protein C with HTH and peptisase S24 domain
MVALSTLHGILAWEQCFNMNDSSQRKPGGPGPDSPGSPRFDGGLGANIRALRIARGLTLAELALRAGTDAGNLSRLERALQGYESGTLEAIARALAVHVSMLFLPPERAGASGRTLQEADIAAYAFVNFYRAEGNVDEAPDEEAQSVAVRRDALAQAGIDPSSLLAYRADSRGMEPRIQLGDLLLIDTSSCKIEDGKVYAVKRAGGLLIARLHLRHDQALRIRQDNPAPQFVEEVVPSTDVSSVAIVGRVVYTSGAIQ